MDEFLVHFCCRHPRGWCGLKFRDSPKTALMLPSPPARVVWIEILYRTSYNIVTGVATREGGVD